MDVEGGHPDDPMLASLIEHSHELHPDDVPAMLRDAGALLPARGVTAYVVDYDQRMLVPLGNPGLEALSIDGSLAGRAYQQLNIVVETVADGVRLWVPALDGADRIGVVAVEVDDDDAQIRRRAAHLASLAAGLIESKAAFGDHLELARRRREMDLAAELRWSMLPPLTFSSPYVAVAGLLEPAYEIAGDCFDYALNGGVLHLAILDAMGHGLEATRIANLALAAYRHARRRGLALTDTFREIDAAVAATFGDERFVTGQLATLALDTGELSLVNAGHPRPFLVRNNKWIGAIECDTRLPLGLGDVVVDASTTSLEPGDTLLLFTDGVTEARSETGELFGGERLADLLVRSIASGLPAAETVRRLVHALLAHEQALQDDATLLLVEWRAPRPPARLSRQRVGW